MISKSLFLSRLIHEEVRLPSIVNIPHKMPYEGDMIWTTRPSHQLHPGFFGGPVAFCVVTLNARAYQVLPGILTASGTGEDMVDRQRQIAPAAKLAAVTVAAKNVLAGEYDLFVRNADIDGKTHHAWKRH